jgi:futalosine hydrolase
VRFSSDGSVSLATVGSSKRTSTSESVLTEILIVAATEPELCRQPGLICGVGPVEAAATTARALLERPADVVLHVGIAGARRDSGLAVGSIVVGAEAWYEDLVTTRRLAPDRVEADPRLVTALSRELGVTPLVIGTTARVAGATAAVEAMEGFAVLRAAQLAGVPAIEVRAVSNLVEDARADWRIEEALETLAQALPGLIASITAAVSESP